MPASIASLRHVFVSTLAVGLAAASLVAAVDASGAHWDDPDAPTHEHLGMVPGGALSVLSTVPSAVHWDVPTIECDGAPPVGQPSAPASCDLPAFTWTVEVEAFADELHVDWDQPLRQDLFELVVEEPGGGAWTQQGQNTYSNGVLVELPDLGLWTIELRPLRTSGTTVRMRAGLVDLVELDEGALLPNLRVTPPLEFGFAAPVNPTNSLFLASDDVNPAVRAAGQEPVSCTADEVQEASDPTRGTPTPLVRCLRFTAGPHNAGDGHFDLRFPVLQRAQNDRDRLVEMTQVVHHADGSTIERAAGTYEFHATHGHYHYTDILFYELYAVGAGGQLTPAGVGNKSGFCPADQGYAEWSNFQRAQRNAVSRIQPGSCLVTGGGNGSMGLSSGWGDFYRWQRPGQYVNFSLQSDGEYVVRTTVDILDNVLESNEDDNASYAWIRVAGNDVEVLERGRGSDPWDPTRIVVEDHRNA